MAGRGRGVGGRAARSAAYEHGATPPNPSPPLRGGRRADRPSCSSSAYFAAVRWWLTRQIVPAPSNKSRTTL